MTRWQAVERHSLWFNKDALDAARFYAATFPDSKVTAGHHAPGDYPPGVAMMEMGKIDIAKIEAARRGPG